jgi:hypothetical protein
MLQRLLPIQADNDFGGHRVALWLFGVLVGLKLVIGLRSMVDARAVAQDADGIPVDTFAPAAAQELLSVFALLGLQHALMGILGVVVLWRYRALVPLMFVILLLERAGRSLVLVLERGAPANPDAPANVIVLAFVALTLAGLALCFWPERAARMPRSPNGDALHERR